MLTVIFSCKKEFANCQFRWSFHFLSSASAEQASSLRLARLSHKWIPWTGSHRVATVAPCWSFAVRARSSSPPTATRAKRRTQLAYQFLCSIHQRTLSSHSRRQPLLQCQPRRRRPDSLIQIDSHLFQHCPNTCFIKAENFWVIFRLRVQRDVAGEWKAPTIARSLCQRFRFVEVDREEDIFAANIEVPLCFAKELLQRTGVTPKGWLEDNRCFNADRADRSDRFSEARCNQRNAVVRTIWNLFPMKLAFSIGGRLVD